jgi:uncharacterized repeat protein (TIGR04138 family)
MAKAAVRSTSRKRYDEEAYRFVVEALHYTQQRLSRPRAQHAEDDSAHISGQELLTGLREFATKSFGMLAGTVLRSWGVRVTDDVGRIVFELIERGEMRKTDRDRLSDFANFYDFREAFVEHYVIDIPSSFKQS